MSRTRSFDGWFQSDIERGGAKSIVTSSTCTVPVGVVRLILRDRARFYEGVGWVARPESSDRAVFFELEWSCLALARTGVWPLRRAADSC
ncbi:MAG: hypothetical protein JO318_15345 [Chloroflexi bacterium]|nr:hypothetical protein [Chloroflexota bacterium]